MFGVKKGWKNWHAFAVVLVTLGLCVPAGAISTDHSHGGHNLGKAGVDKPAWLEKLEDQLEHEDLMSGMDGSQKKTGQYHDENHGSIEVQAQRTCQSGFFRRWVSGFLGRPSVGTKLSSRTYRSGCQSI